MYNDMYKDNCLPNRSLWDKYIFL